jgi:hypothetical protein
VNKVNRAKLIRISEVVPSNKHIIGVGGSDRCILINVDCAIC